MKQFFLAELVIGQIIALSRQITDLNSQLHSIPLNEIPCTPAGQPWKIPLGSEIRGKTIGIVGYGHIGTQLSVLADSLGVSVLFHDILNINPLGMAKKTKDLDELLRNSDFVSLHVPETPETKNMIGAKEFAKMKKGSYFINASRGTVVDLDSLANALKSGHLAGSAVVLKVYTTYFNHLYAGCISC